MWPFVVRALSLKRLLMLCIGLAAASLWIRFGMRMAGSGPQPVYMWTICRMDALALGAAVAALLRMPRAAALLEHRDRAIGLGRSPWAWAASSSRAAIHAPRA